MRSEAIRLREMKLRPRAKAIKALSDGEIDGTITDLENQEEAAGLRGHMTSGPDPEILSDLRWERNSRIKRADRQKVVAKVKARLVVARKSDDVERAATVKRRKSPAESLTVPQSRAIRFLALDEGGDWISIKDAGLSPSVVRVLLSKDLIEVRAGDEVRTTPAGWEMAHYADRLDSGLHEEVHGKKKSRAKVKQRKATPLAVLRLKTGVVGHAESKPLIKAAKQSSATPVKQSTRARAHARNVVGEKEGASLPVLDVPGAKHGRQADALIGAENGPRKLLSAFALVEVAGLITSHDASTFQPDPRYPEGVQERDYHRDPHERLKVARNAASLVPEYLVNNNPDAVNGPPIVAKNGVVLGGNSRAMTLFQAYKDGRAAEYRALLVVRAPIFGFTGPDLDSFEAPVLVRVVDESPDDWSDLSRRLNESATQEKNLASDSVSLGKRISPAAWSALATGVEGDTTLAAFLASPASRAFVAELHRDGVIEARNAGRLTDATGLNDEGRRWVSRAVLGALLEDSALIEGIGSRKREIVARVAPAVIAAADEGRDIRPQLRQAMELHREATARGMRVDALIAQEDIFAVKSRSAGDGERLAILLEAEGERAFVARLRRFGIAARNQPAGQAGLFGPAPSDSDLLWGD